MSTSGTAATLAIVMSGVVGLAVGSFLNVVAYRVPRGLSLVRPPSQCPSCGTRLTGLDLVPVLSWAVLRARCRHCREPVSARYPIVEAATGAAFAAAAAAIRPTWPLVPVLVVTACALAAAALDADGAPPPRLLALVAVVAAGAMLPVAAALAEPSRAGWGALGAVLAGLAGYFLDRTRPDHRIARAAVLAALGGAAGTLWVGGGPFAATWIVVATAVTAVGATRRAPLALLLAGSFAAVVASGAIGHP